jgi:hypothetical protein
MFFLAVVLLFVAVGLAATFAMLQGRSRSDRTGAVQDRFTAIRSALEQFVATNGYLPCPANGAASDGVAMPAVATATCTAGVTAVPWRTLGMRADDAIDPWGWQISYRVYAPGVGSLTQADGASMVDCDTDELFPIGVGATGTCRVTRDTLPAQFLAGKGIRVNNFGATILDAAYVLVSHGATGFGAFTSAGVRNTLPANVAELANVNGAEPYVAQAPSAPGLAPGSLNHFDDVLYYQALPDLIRTAGRGARSWTDTNAAALASVVLDTASISAALGRAASPGNLGQSTLTFPAAQMSGYGSGGARNLTLATQASTQGIGIQGGGNQITSSRGEGVNLAFNAKARRFSITLASFGTFVNGGSTYTERVRLRFFDGVTEVSPAGGVVKSGCKAEPTLATFILDVGSDYSRDFDKVEVTPLDASGPGSRATAFLISEFKSCAASGGTCITGLGTAGNFCP